MEELNNRLRLANEFEIKDDQQQLKEKDTYDFSKKVELDCFDCLYAKTGDCFPKEKICSEFKYCDELKNLRKKHKEDEEQLSRLEIEKYAYLPDVE